MISEQIQEIELNIKQAQAIVDVGTSLERLKSNKDFKKVILEGYFEREAIRLVHLKSDSNMQTVDIQRSIDDQIKAIGNLNQYFQTVFHKANMASSAIASDEETRDELIAEELE